MISTLVATNGHWGAYIATQEMLERKGQPLFLASFERPSEVTTAINEKFPGQFTGYTDYGDFWQRIAEAGIQKPDVMPHRDPYTKEDWKKGRVRNCFACEKIK